MARRQTQETGSLEARLRELTLKLMLIPGLSGTEDRVRRAIAAELRALGLDGRGDRLGNLIATIPATAPSPSVMLFAHMDQVGLVVRKIEASGLIRVERLGGVPERALPSQEVLFCVGVGRDAPGVIANKSHHATGQDEKYRVLPYPELFIDAGFSSLEDVRAAGIDIGTPVVYAAKAIELAGGRIAGTSVDDRAGCAVLVEVARALLAAPARPTVHVVFSVQEEFNLRGVLPVARALAPDIAIQIDLMLATDTPDMAARGDVRLGGGPAMSLYSFHGRGTLNGLIPHPALVRHFTGKGKIGKEASRVLDAIEEGDASLSDLERAVVGFADAHRQCQAVGREQYDRRARLERQAGGSGLALVEQTVTGPGALRVDAEQLTRAQHLAGGVEGRLRSVAPAAIDGDHPHRRKQELRLPRIHVLGLADEVRAAGHREHQHDRVEERDVVRCQDDRSVSGHVLCADDLDRDQHSVHGA